MNDIREAARKILVIKGPGYYKNMLNTYNAHGFSDLGDTALTRIVQDERAIRELKAEMDAEAKANMNTCRTCRFLSPRIGIYPSYCEKIGDFDGSGEQAASISAVDDSPTGSLYIHQPDNFGCMYYTRRECVPSWPEGLPEELDDLPRDLMSIPDA